MSRNKDEKDEQSFLKKSGEYGERKPGIRKGFVSAGLMKNSIGPPSFSPPYHPADEQWPVTEPLAGGGHLSIKKLVAKGDTKNPQTLLVVGTTRIEEDFWVHIGLSAASCIGEPDFHTICEMARRRHAGKDGNLNDDVTSFCKVTAAEDEMVWVARFDFENHRRWRTDYEIDHDLFQLWADFVSTSAGCAPDEVARGICITAWVPDKEIRVVERFSLQNVMQIYPVEVGVLLVHGIGPHKKRETLTKFTEPILEVWAGWLGSLNRESIGKDSSGEWQKMFARFGNFTRNVVDHDGISRCMDDRNKKRKDNKGPGETVCGCIRVEDTEFTSSDEGDPDSALVRFSLVNGRGDLEEAHVLFTEAYWTKQTVYPEPGELLLWISEALPVLFSMHAAGALRPVFQEVRSSDISLKEKIFSLPMYIIQCGIALFRFPLAVLVQAGLYCLALVSLLPFTPVRRLFGSLLDVLIGTTGQSYALKKSRIRRNAIVAQVAEKLEWLANRCEKVVVLSHSQGAEIMRLVLQARRFPSLRRWITFGAGIKPLNMLSDEAVKELTKDIKRIFKELSFATVVLVLYWLLQMLMTKDYLIFQFLPAEPLLMWHGVLLILVGVYLYFCAFSVLEKGEHSLQLNLSRAAMEVWHDYFASHDPVSSGSLFDPHKKEIREGKLPEPDQSRLENLRSVLRDHNAYFENTEQFVAPVVAEILRQLEMAPREQSKVQAVLEKYSLKRREFIRRRVNFRFAALIVFLGLLVLFPYLNRQELWPLIKTVWAAGDGTLPTRMYTSGLLRILAYSFSPSIGWTIAYCFIRHHKTDRFTRETKSALYKDLAACY